MILWFMEMWTPTLFKWNFGYAFLWADWPAYQLAEYIGTTGLSALVISINWVAWRMWCHRTQALLLLRWTSIFVALLGGSQVAGWWGGPKTFKSPTESPTPSSFKPILETWKKPMPPRVGATETTSPRNTSTKPATRWLLPPPPPPPFPIDFVLWPETAFPHYLGEPYDKNPYAHAVLQMVQDIKTPLITGSYSKNTEDDLVANSVFFIDEKGHYVGAAPYHKIHLVPFGEYIPLSGLFPILRKWIPEAGNFHRGKKLSVKELNGLKLGTQICYESLFPSFSVELANKGAQIFINVTNDSWYGTWQEPYQHLYQNPGQSCGAAKDPW